MSDNEQNAVRLLTKKSIITALHEYALLFFFLFPSSFLSQLYAGLTPRTRRSDSESEVRWIV